MCNAVWTSYAFKTKNIDLAIVTVTRKYHFFSHSFFYPALIIGIIITAIYLSVKPESSLIKQFFFVILLSQIFNFDMVPTTMCGMLGTITSIMSSSVSLMFMPEVIKTRDVTSINLPMSSMNALNYFIWTLVAIWIHDGFMITSQGLGVVFNSILIMFYLWAKKFINPTDTPAIWPVMSMLISFFKHFTVQNHCKDMKEFFWQDENTQEAQTYIK